MAVFYSKTRGVRIFKAKEKAKKNTSKQICRECGNPSVAVEEYKDRTVYRCTNCNTTNTYTNLPNNAITGKDKKKKEKYAPIKIVDKSKKEKSKKEKSDEQKPIETVEKNVRVASLELIRNAMENKSILEFEYKSSDEKKAKDRTVEPYKLDRDKNGNLILWAYCLENEGIRRFVLRNINPKKVNKLDYTFDPKWDIEDRLKSNEQ